MEQFVEQLFLDPIFQRPENILSVVMSLVSAALLALPIAWVYMLTAKKDGYKQSFVQALIFLSFIVAAAMLVIGNNLARAFGLVGAVSIIRFRSRVNNPRDIAFIFVAITIGMASGLALYSVASLTSIMMSLLAFLFYKYNFAATQKIQEYIFSVQVRSITSSERLIAEILHKAVDRWKLEKVHCDNGVEFVLEYRVWLNGRTSMGELMDTVRNAGKGYFSGLEYVNAEKDSNILRNAV